MELSFVFFTLPLWYMMHADTWCMLLCAPFQYFLHINPYNRDILDCDHNISWRCRGLNPGPHTCKACALPLSYIPCVFFFCFPFPSDPWIKEDIRMIHIKLILPILGFTIRIALYFSHVHPSFEPGTSRTLMENDKKLNIFYLSFAHHYITIVGQRRLHCQV